MNDKVELMEQEPEVVAMALMYIYTGAYTEEDIVNVWPKLRGRFAAEGDDWTRFLDTRIKLYMLAEFLLIDGLLKATADDLISWLDEKSGNSASLWGLTSSTWTDALSGMIQNTSACQDLLERTYEHIPRAGDLRARATIRAFDWMRDAHNWLMQKPSRPFSNHGWVDTPLSDEKKKANKDFETTAEQLGHQVTELQERLSSIFDRHDTVAFYVAHHYRETLAQRESDLQRMLDEERQLNRDLNKTLTELTENEDNTD
jgi:hypothetical protein